MKQSTLQNVVWKEGAHFVAQCLNIDISSFGDTREDALSNLDEAINLYFEDMSNFDIQIVESPEIVNIDVKYA